MVSRENRIEVEGREDPVAVVVVEGEHDLSTAAELRESIAGLADQGRPLVVDLSRATFVDSSILAALIEAGRARDDGQGFSVVVPADASPAVANVIEVTQLGEILAVRETREEAVAVAGGVDGA